MARTAKQAKAKQQQKTTRVTRGEEFEAQHIAETTDLSPNQARELLRKYGNDWRRVEGEAKSFKAEG
jgi:hypothetical protein